jgi:hypothetical protein
MPAARRQNAILFVGLNPEAVREAQELRRSGSQVVFIGNSKTADRIVVNGRAFDLATADGRIALLGIMKLSAFQQNVVTPIVANAYRNSRDELGKLALAWASTEHGHPMPTRMVISAHHAGTSEFWGHNNGIITFQQIKSLASAFPRAAAAIQHLHFSACYSALNMMIWPSAFPNLMTMWAYSGSAPGSLSGAALHLRIWERATRGAGMQLHRAGAKNTRKGGNVTVWSRQYGIETEEVAPIEELRSREAADRHVFQEYFEGSKLVVETDSGPLRDYYNEVQALLNHSDLRESERPALEKRREATIRLVFYQSNIRGKFQEAYSDAVAAGFAALKLNVPDFSRLDRKQALAAISEFQTKVGTSPAAAVKRCLQLLTEGLRDLDGKFIPANWI